MPSAPKADKATRPMQATLKRNIQKNNTQAPKRCIDRRSRLLHAVSKRKKMPSAPKPDKATLKPNIQKNNTQPPKRCIDRLSSLLHAVSRRKKMPRFYAPGVVSTPADLEAGMLLRMQFLEREGPMVGLVHLTLGALGKSQAVDILRFLAAKVTFYDVELLVTDPLRFKCRLAMWKEKARTKRMKQSPVDISTTLALDNLYTRSVTNESNMYKGRNTLANEEKEDV